MPKAKKFSAYQNTMVCSILYKVLGRLSTKVKVLFANIEAKYSCDVSSTFTTIASLKFSKTSTHPTATLVQKVSDGMKLHPLIRGSRNVTNLHIPWSLKSFQHGLSPSPSQSPGESNIPG